MNQAMIETGVLESTPAALLADLQELRDNAAYRFDR